MDLDRIHTCVFQHPIENLHDRAVRSRGPEARFVGAFSSIYQSRFAAVHPGTTRRRTLFVREVPVPGSGIADLVVLSWRGNRSPGVLSRLLSAPRRATMRTFEAKLSNWRKGLMQAHRYRYFSDAAILVVPARKLRCLTPHLHLFRKLGVGVWGFDEESNGISRLYTPHPRRQHVRRLYDDAIAAVVDAASL